jgi:hypothetical protein
LAIVVPAVANASVEDSNEQLFPESVRVVLLVPVQTVALPAVPPTDAGSTVIVPVALTVPQPPVNGM